MLTSATTSRRRCLRHVSSYLVSPAPSVAATVTGPGVATVTAPVVATLTGTLVATVTGPMSHISHTLTSMCCL